MTPTKICQKLIRFPSITPEDHGVIQYVASYLEPLGFKCVALPFKNNTGTITHNLYARKGTTAPNLCFGAHVDVVPPGNTDAWKFPPFSGELYQNKIWGRGAVDMKGALAAYLAAIEEIQHIPGSLSFIITGDEEGSGENGTRKIIEWLQQSNEKVDFCLVGEPTSTQQLGDTLKIGRRGSLNGVISVDGIQGHVAYPHNAFNPIPNMLTLLATLKKLNLTQPYENFQQSNLEITSVDTNNTAFNVIPARITAQFNIRFNPAYSGTQLTQEIERLLNTQNIKHRLHFEEWSDAFLTPSHPAIDALTSAITTITNTTPNHTTGGGTSDARFIKNICPVVEFGLKNSLAHKVDEYVDIDDLNQLTAIYAQFITNFFNASA